ANFFLATFNLLPGLPLDGGRALRAILWQRRKDILSATRTTMKLGVWLAYLLISYGVLLATTAAMRGKFWQDFTAAAWLLVLGVFLKSAAENDYRYRERQSADERMGRDVGERSDMNGPVGGGRGLPAVHGVRRRGCQRVSGAAVLEIN